MAAFYFIKLALLCYLVSLDRSNTPLNAYNLHSKGAPRRHCFFVFLFDQTKIYVMNFVLSNKILYDNTKKRSSLDAPLVAISSSFHKVFLSKTLTMNKDDGSYYFEL